MESRYKMTVSQTPSAEPDSSGSYYKSFFRHLFGRTAMTSEEFWNSRAYFPVVLGAAAVFLFTGHEIAGMIVLAAFITYMQMTCRDLMAAVLPEVLFLLLGTRYYDDLGSLLSIWWLIPPFAYSYYYNLTHWRIHLRRGACWNSLLAVAFAALVGGIGVISFKDYFSLNGLMYGVGLGAGMVLASVLYWTSLTRARSYDICSRFCGILYSIGIFTGFVVVNYYLTHTTELAQNSGILYIHFRNYLTTMLVLALPMPFRFMKGSRIHTLSAAFIYVSLLLTGSRSALVFGTVILFACAFITITSGKKLTRGYIALIVLFSAAAAVMIFLLGRTVLSSRLIDGKLFPVTDSRIMFLRQSVLDFISNPINGIGLANMQNSKIFLGVDGSMVWYHNYFAQIIGSMGLVGIFAYTWLLRDRYRYLRVLGSSGEMMLVMSYLGILMVSMTNPGEFCPLPNEFLIVLLFDVAETVRAAKSQATVSGETSYVVWAPARHRVKLGEYGFAGNTVSISSGITPLVLPPEYAEGPAPREGTVRLLGKDPGEE